MKTGKFSDFFVTFVVKKNDETKEFRYITEDKVFHFAQGNSRNFLYCRWILQSFFDAQMSKYTFMECFFLKYIRQTHVFFRYPRTTFQSFISSARYSNRNIFRFIIKSMYSAYSFYAISSIRKIVLNERPRDTEYAPQNSISWRLICTAYSPIVYMPVAE